MQRMIDHIKHRHEYQIIKSFDVSENIITVYWFDNYTRSIFPCSKVGRDLMQKILVMKQLGFMVQTLDSRSYVSEYHCASKAEFDLRREKAIVSIGDESAFKTDRFEFTPAKIIKGVFISVPDVAKSLRKVMTKLICKDCRDGYYYPLTGPREPCKTCIDLSPSLNRS